MKFVLAIATLIATGLSLHGDIGWSWTSALAIALAAVTVWVFAVDLLLDFEPAWDELHLATTSDGWSIPLYRYRREGARGAVMLVHGIYSSMHLFDLGPEESLARHLRAQG